MMADSPPSTTPSPANSVEAHAPLATSLVGVVLLDRFRVIEQIGEGGMAIVFLAEHVTIHKKCAIKVLLPEHASKPELVERFLREARAASLIEHENVVEITDYGTAPNGSVFFVMERLEGEELADTIDRDGSMSWPRARPILLQICRALAAAHGKGVVHRDMKPENVFLIRRHGSSDFVKVLDFGIAKLLSEVRGARSLTQTGVIIGTPQYMSPEQAESLVVDHRADIYSLGVIMYELLTGQVPFTGDTYAKLLAKHLFEPPVAPSQVAPDAEILPEVEAIILKAMQKDRELRFQSVGELARAIEAVGTGAAPVAVVEEHRPRPQTRGSAMTYADSQVGSEALASHELELRGLPAVTNSRSIALRVGIGLAALIAGVVVTWAVLNRPQQPQGQAQTQAPPQIPALEAKAPAPELPTPSPTVNVVLTTNIDAEVVDAVSGAVLGHTNEVPGFTLDRGEVAREVLIRAEGHDDLPLRLMPNSDIAGSHELVKTKGREPPKKKKKKKKKKDDDPFSLLPMDNK